MVFGTISFTDIMSLKTHLIYAEMSYNIKCLWTLETKGFLIVSHLILHIYSSFLFYFCN